MVSYVNPRIERDPLIIHIRYCENPNCIFCRIIKAYLLKMSEILTLNKIAIIRHIVSCADDKKMCAISHPTHSERIPFQTIEELHQRIVPLLILP